MLQKLEVILLWWEIIPFYLGFWVWWILHFIFYIVFIQTEFFSFSPKLEVYTRHLSAKENKPINQYYTYCSFCGIGILLLIIRNCVHNCNLSTILYRLSFNINKVDFNKNINVPDISLTNAIQETEERYCKELTENACILYSIEYRYTIDFYMDYLYRHLDFSVKELANMLYIIQSNKGTQTILRGFLIWLSI